MTTLTDLTNRYQKTQEIVMSLAEYLELCKKDPGAYASPAQRLLTAIGDPELFDTAIDPRLGRIFSNEVIRIYKPFKDIFGVEYSIMRLVDFIVHAAQGLEEAKQILYLLGPVGSAKSTVADILKNLFETQPVYVIQGSPVNDSPLSLFSPKEDGPGLLEEYGIPIHRLRTKPSGWLLKRIKEHGGDLSFIKVVKTYPSIINQRCMSVVEAQDPNNQDISTLVGKTNIRMIGTHDQHDPDCYNYSGGLNKANQGMMEFREMFKADPSMTNPLLFACQEGIYNGTEAIGGLPFEGIIIAHSNETEWNLFKNNHRNEAMLDRVYLVTMPYNLRVDEEIKIYDKHLRTSTLCKAPCAPETKKILAKMFILSRLVTTKQGSMNSKIKVYNGTSLKNKDPEAQSLDSYRSEAGLDEGMSGLSTRLAYKILATTFNMDPTEIAADPINLFYVLENTIRHERLGAEKEALLLGFLKEIQQHYIEVVGKELQKGAIESYHAAGQNRFDRYVATADAYLQDQDFRDPETHLLWNRDMLNLELEKLEKPAGITNPKDFRNEVVTFCLRARDKNKGKNPDWTSYIKIKDVIEKALFVNIEEILPVLSYETQKNEESKRKHNSFIKTMCALGYTEKQVRRVVEYYIRYRKK